MAAGASYRKATGRTARAAAADIIAEQRTVWGRSADDLRSALLEWYALHGRRLPWRESRDAYRIWLSEIMLQQTTVAAVIPYFQRFTQRYPTVRDLAAASVDDVLRLWEGLGYYSRARNLHRTAVRIVTEYNGEFPADSQELQQLPGVGRYTAGAIASFAFGIPAPIVEANTQRLYARLMALEEDIRTTAAVKQLWAFAETIVSPDHPADFNQAVMDLGARVCTVTNPVCHQCPLAAQCAACREQLQQELPRRGAPQEITPLNELTVVLRRGDQVLVRLRGADERWTAMWDFPRLEISEQQLANVPRGVQRTGKGKALAASLFAGDQEPLDENLAERIQQQCGILPGVPEESLKRNYSVTRYRVQMLAIVCAVSGRLKRSLPNGYCWKSLPELTELPMPRTGRQIVEWLQRRV